MTLYKECPGSKRIKTPFPEEIQCSCGKTAEIWSDETSVVCKSCNKGLTREMQPNCLDWCSLARECVGEKKHKGYLASKKQKEVEKNESNY